MGYYDALVAKWPSLSATTTAAKLVEINGLTVAGPTVDIPITRVTAYLLLNGIPAKARLFLAAPPAGATTEQLVTAQSLLDLITTPTLTSVQMTNAAVAATVDALLSNLVAIGVMSQADVTNLVALSQTQIPWWQSAGYSSPISNSDLAAAGGLT